MSDHRFPIGPITRAQSEYITSGRILQDHPSGYAWQRYWIPEPEFDLAEPIHTLDMRRIVALVRAKGVPCIVEQTGGGCATIYAGEPNPDVQWEDEPNYYPVAAGPGTFYPTPEADDRDFTCGPTNQEAFGIEYTDCEGMAEDAIAAEIVRWTNKNQEN